ncbi:MAG: putative nucleotidyltransferase [Roseivirga sp.]|jgi:predicted nucleotidyltransferase
MLSTKSEVTELLSANGKQIASYGAKSLGLFGSFVCDQATSESDVDFVVEFLPEKKNYDNFIQLSDFLETLLGRKVELVTNSSISKYLKPHIDKSIEYVALGL